VMSVRGLMVSCYKGLCLYLYGLRVKRIREYGL
jgi:hypothetical protein